MRFELLILLVEIIINETKLNWILVGFDKGHNVITSLSFN